MNHYNVGVDNPRYGKPSSKGFLGRRHTKKSIKKISLATLAEKNGMWKGNDVDIGCALHMWVKRRLLKPKKCPKCKKIRKQIDLCNITGNYTRDLKNWEYQCRSCHMKADGRMANLKYSGPAYLRGVLV